MSISADFIEQLLHEEEGTTLDFKRDQYSFAEADEQAKSELLKDILAFANTFRHADSYILIGVEEIRGGKSQVVGVSSQLDDAHLQQFVNGKTQLPVTFSYRQANHECLPIGIIHIPLQARPVYAKVNYGKVKKGHVYLRRGSSTGVARPEEVSMMGFSANSSPERPSVELRLVSRDSGQVLGNRAIIPNCTRYEIALNMIPDYEEGTTFGTAQVQAFQVDPFTNRNYLREVAAYVQTEACFPVSLEMRNCGGVVIKDLILSIKVPDVEGRFHLLAGRDRPSLPSTRFMDRLVHRPSALPSDIQVKKEGDTWKITCAFGKIQPHAVVRLQDDLLVGSRSQGEATFGGLVFADNITSPISVSFRLIFEADGKPLTIEKVSNIGNMLS